MLQHYVFILLLSGFVGLSQCIKATYQERFVLSLLSHQFILVIHYNHPL
jgi:hypothetical protein